MERQYKENTDNGVKGSCFQKEVAVPPGRNSHEQQVTSVRHQDTASRSEGHAQQVTLLRHQETASTTRKYRVATWNVRTLHQAVKLENVEREMTMLGVDILGLSEVRWPGAGLRQT